MALGIQVALSLRLQWPGTNLVYYTDLHWWSPGIGDIMAKVPFKNMVLICTDVSIGDQRLHWLRIPWRILQYQSVLMVKISNQMQPWQRSPWRIIQYQSVLMVKISNQMQHWPSPWGIIQYESVVMVKIWDQRMHWPRSPWSIYYNTNLCWWSRSETKGCIGQEAHEE